MFTNCFMKLYKITNSTKLRDFQYRLLHKKIPSNRELHKWGVKKNDRCELCSEQDSIQHLLYYCDHVIDIWQQWIAEVHDNFNIKIDLTFEMIVLNTFTNRPGSLINLMGLVLKQLIFRYKCLGKKISYRIFKHELEFIEKIKLYKTRLTNRFDTHQRKWEVFSSQ